jgi:hypothetical protein
MLAPAAKGVVARSSRSATPLRFLMVIDTNTVVTDLSTVARVQGCTISSPCFLWLCAKAADGMSMAAPSSRTASNRIMGMSRCLEG